MSQTKAAELFKTLQDSLIQDHFVRLNLSAYRGAEEGLKNWIIRRIVIKREDMLSVTFRYKTRDIVKNFPPADALPRIEGALQDFDSATLLTTQGDYAWQRHNTGRETLKKSPPSQPALPPAVHDHQKTRAIAADAPWLRALGLSDAQGVVYKTAQDKFRQINRYVEILDPLIRDLPPEDLRSVVDMGSGKGYLTFALYEHLVNGLERDVNVTGIEYRGDLVRLCNDAAKASGFGGLRFVEGAIAGYKAERTDMLIALHACDTATDDAIAAGLAAKAALIVVAPCCHKQIRAEMEKALPPPGLGPLLRHGIFMERQAEMVTDALRALYLEYCGYSIKVFEFISGDHTAKNVMITAIRNSKAKIHDPAVRDKIRALKTLFGIRHHALERAAGLDI